MEFANSLKSKIDYFIDGIYEFGDPIDSIPVKDEVSTKKKIKKIELCSFCIDMRNSTKILEESNIQDVIKIHKAFLGIASKVVVEYKGIIRDYQGDCLLAFWPLITENKKDQLFNAVKAAMVIKWFITKDYLTNFHSKYPNLDFGIGIDFGKVHILRVGLTDKPEYNDLVFLGKCVNFSVHIANTLSKPDYIGLTEAVYSNLKSTAIYYNKDKKVNMWTDKKIKWKSEDCNIKTTTYGWIQK